MPDTNTRGRFITLEGGEGTGKSSLQAALADRLRGAGLDVVLTREPGGTPLAEEIRALALHPPGDEAWSPMAEALLMNTARTDHLEKLIRPALAIGEWVLCDRFSDSTLAYQSAGDGVNLDILRMIEARVLGQTRPDLTLVLDADWDVARARVEARCGDSDAFELRSRGYHEAVRQAFLDIAEDDPARCRVIDASQDQASVLSAAWDAVSDAFSLQAA